MRRVRLAPAEWLAAAEGLPRGHDQDVGSDGRPKEVAEPEEAPRRGPPEPCSARPSRDHKLGALICGPGVAAGHPRGGRAAAYHSVELFTARLSNPYTRAAYGRAVGGFLRLCESLGSPSPRRRSKPRGDTIRQHPPINRDGWMIRASSQLPVGDARANKESGLLSHRLFRRSNPLGRAGFGDGASSSRTAATPVARIVLVAAGVASALEVSCGSTCSQAPALPDSVLEGSRSGVTASHAPALARGETWALRIAFLDVRQSDAIVMVSNDGEAMVIDAGHGTTAAQAIIAFLCNQAENGPQAFNVIEAMVATHYAQDHVGGADEAIAAVTVARAYDQGPSLRTDLTRTREVSLYSSRYRFIADL